MDKFFSVLLILLLIPSLVSAQVNTTELASQLEASNPLTGFMSFVLSDYFIWFWILVIISAIFVPIGAIFGIPTIFKWYDRTFVKPKKGFIIIRQFLPNDQVMEFFGKPTGQMMPWKDWNGNPINIPIKLGKGWSKYSGSLPVIEVDENGHQRPVDTNMQSPISQEEITKGWKASFETGKFLSGDFMAEFKKWIILLVIVAIAGAGINAFFGYTNMQALSPNSLASAYHTAIVNTTATSTVTVSAGG